MNKKIIFTSCLIMMLVTVPTVVGQTRTASPSATNAPSKGVEDEVDKLKEKVAEKVTKLQGREEKAVAGVIQIINSKMITVSNEDKKSDITLDDTLTKYYEVQGSLIKSIKKDDVTKGDYIFAAGPDINGSINANGIYKDVNYRVLSGKITEVNKDDFSVKVVTSEKNNYILDVQTRTTQEMLNIKTLEKEKVGFSKLKEGDSIHFVIKANLANKNQTRFDAEKMLIIPNEYFLQ